MILKTHCWIWLAIVFTQAIPTYCAAADDSIARQLPADHELIRRWQDMRFGMFIHWGPVSLKGTEIGWSRGQQVPAEKYDSGYVRFNPDGVRRKSVGATRQ